MTFLDLKSVGLTAVPVRVRPPAPYNVPSIDKKIFVSRRFQFCPKVLYLRRFRAFSFLLCSNSWCIQKGLFEQELTRTRHFGGLILTIYLEIVKIEPIAGVSFNDIRKGCALNLCR